MASWRAVWSILEGPGVDFGGSGLNFFKIFACFWPNLPRTCRGLAQLVDAYLRSLRFCGLAPLGRDLLRGGGAAVVPPRGFQSAAHRRCAGRAEPQPHRLQPKLQILPQMAKLLMASSSSCSEGSYTPLFFSPQEPGDHRRPCAKKRKNGTLWLFFSIFCLSELQSKFCIEKTSKKV